MKKKSIYLVFALIIINLFWINCKRSERSIDTNDHSCSKVVIAALSAANSGNISKANAFFCPFSQIDNNLKPMTINFWDDITNNGTIENMEVLEENIRGEIATVVIKVIYKDGDSNKMEINLFKMKRKWLIYEINKS